MDLLLRSWRTVPAVLAAVVLAAWGGLAAGAESWPGSRDGLEFAWQASNRPNSVTDPVTQSTRSCRVTPRGMAVFGRFFDMDLSSTAGLRRGGEFVVEGEREPRPAASAKTHQVTVEAVITPGPAPKAVARIITFLTGAGTANFMLGQESDALVLHLRTSETAGTDVPAVKLGKVAEGRPVHVLVSYSPGHLTCLRDGEPVALPSLAGDLGNWAPQTIVFGGGWKGQIEGVAIYSRALGAEEAKAHYAMAAARLKGRKAAERLVVEARLVATTATPDPKDIAPYVRALTGHRYEVVKVEQGRYDRKELLAARWAILDKTVLPTTRRVGESYRLVLERFEDHPELEPERLVMDGATSDLPLFYEVEP
jgi:hypothetical protein